MQRHVETLPERVRKRYHKELEEKIKDFSEIQMGQLEVITPIGKGSFGTVYLVSYESAKRGTIHL